MEYIYIDESGDLGKGGSKYFIIAGIKVNNYRNLDRLINKSRRNNKKKIGKSNEIKGTTIPPEIKKKILKSLNKIDYESFIIVLNKKDRYKINYKNDNHLLYDILSSELAKLINISSSTEVYVDRTRRNKQKIANYNEIFKKNLNNPKNHPISIKHVDSLKYKGVQIADLISWSAYQSIENNNDEYIKIVKNKIMKTVYED
ncbi:MAG: DUF3800 domain-containing protein [Methanobrevibacter sp.]|uniref:DUF3800 domain-containing protein n=1 Tax=Methanobrevibacter sp. TaxID=66852 RepID=UPI0025FEB384|nr:DUF3800 domain-containing protein [Methanobrevibacter sp.]MBR0271404.1 DUF3800 domain-containing protein [Methanobrevibacter sp.]